MQSPDDEVPDSPIPRPTPEDPETAGASLPQGRGPEVWELPSSVPSAWVGFWPHPEPPSQEEVGRALATWIGREIDAEAAQPEGEEGMLWALMVKVPGVVSPIVFWAERALAPEPAQLEDPAMAACRWVLGVQTILEPGEAHAEYFHVVAMVAGALPEIVGVLDVVTGRRFPRVELEQQFLAQDAVPNDEFLWSVSAVATSESPDAPTMLFTTGLTRASLPELEMLEVPARHSQAAAVLINHVASLLLEAPPPAPGAPIEIGPQVSVALVPWQECAPYVEEGAPGSQAFRDEARAQGDTTFNAVRAVVCAPERQGQFRRLWTWPRETIERMESGRAVLYASEHSSAASERRAQRTFAAFATAFASVRRADAPEVSALAESAFHVQAPVGGVDDEERLEQGWFVVRRFEGDVVEAALAEDPVTRSDFHAGDEVRIPRDSITDWRVVLPDDVYAPDRSIELMAAVDRLRGLA
ncbi:MAG: DUF2314 domain-containing protein [Phycisphaerales bacterium]